MLKCLIFHPALAPYRVDFFNQLAKWLDLHLVLLDDNLRDQQFNQANLLGALKCRVSHLLTGFVIRRRYFRSGIWRMIRRERPNIVIGYEYSPTTLALVLAKLMISKSQLRVWVTTDDNVEMIRSCAGLRSRLRSFVLRYIDGLIVTSHASKAALLAVSLRSDLPVCVIPIVHDEAVFRANEAKIYREGWAWRCANLEPSERMVLFVGRYAAVKNLPFLIRAFSRLPQELLARLVIVGGGTDEERKAINRTIQDEDVQGRIVLAGRYEGDLLRRFFAATDMLVLPSHYEPYGAVVGEALLWGKPCLVSEAVGASELILSPSCGEVFTLAEDDLVQCLRRWLLKPQAADLAPSLIGNLLETSVIECVGEMERQQ